MLPPSPPHAAANNERQAKDDQCQRRIGRDANTVPMTTPVTRLSLEAVEALAGRFDAAAIPAIEWTHEMHLMMGVWHVARFGPEAALERLRAGIRRLNAAHGTIDSDTRGYHETITRAYVRVIAGFLRGRPSDEPLDGSIAALLAGPLAARDLLLRHYSRERLFAVAARRGWVEPDREPLPSAAKR
jgi:hypothetical protein